MRNILSFGAAAAADLLSTLSIPGGGITQRLVEEVISRRLAVAREELVKELANGFHGFVALGREDIDPLIGILMRFQRAAEEGLSRDNLRLLAQIIGGLKKQRALEFDRFARWASILESLSRDELLLIGTAYQLDAETKEPPGSDDRRFHMPLRDRMAAKGFSNEEFEVLCMGVARHGLLRGASGWGMFVYDATEWLRELGRLADLAGQATERRS